MAEPTQRDQTVAVLMDFENTKDANLQRVLSIAAGFGQVIIRRAYADWSRHARAQSALREAGFEAVHQFTTGAGSKNATDINLTVDAMDMLWSRPVDVFVLVTADSDFAKLAMRMREGGKRVIGIGAKGRVGRALVQACDQYNYYDEGKKSTQTAGGRSKQRGKGTQTQQRTATTTATAEKADIGPLHVLVVSCFESAADDDGWVYGSDLHRTIKRVHPDFSYRDHGFSSFRSFIESMAPVLSTETDDERSDFLVWIADSFEKAMWKAVEAQETTGGDPSTDPGGETLVLADDVQERIHDAWTDAAGKRGRLQGSKAGTIVAREYGVDRLRDTPLVDLDGVLRAAPKLATRWRRDRASLVRR